MLFFTSIPQLDCFLGIFKLKFGEYLVDRRFISKQICDYYSLCAEILLETHLAIWFTHMFEEDNVKYEVFMIDGNVYIGKDFKIHAEPIHVVLDITSRRLLFAKLGSEAISAADAYLFLSHSFII